jgi:hypothetical protein
MSSMQARSTSPEVFDRLPDDLVLKILSQIPHDQFRNVALVDRRFNRISKDASLWKKVSFPKVRFYVDTSSS